jgi:hypothetical protein
MYHRYQQKNTMHFCVVAELADDLDPSALEAGLLAVQDRHPLLTVHVEDHPRTRLGFLPSHQGAADPGHGPRRWGGPHLV